MGASRRPGPKPKRLYARLFRTGDPGRPDLPSPAQVREFLDSIQRVDRLVAHGPLTTPSGDLLLLRAADLAEAERILRRDPFRNLESTVYEVLEWDPSERGTGINLDPPPPRGSGRLTLLQRIGVVVRRQSESLPWYRNVLGLEVRSEDPGTHYIELALGKGVAGLSLVEPSPTWGEPLYSETLERVGKATGIVFQTDSVLALEQRLLRAGTPVTQGPERQPWGGVTIRFSDPDGNEFLAYQTASDPTAPTVAAARTPSEGFAWSRRAARPKRT